ARDALEKLCRIYWRPIYTFVHRQNIGPEEAEDLTQGFFALLLERKDRITSARRKGDSVLTCLHRSRTFSLTNGVVSWRSSEEKKNGSFHWIRFVSASASMLNRATGSQPMKSTNAVGHLRFWST